MVERLDGLKEARHILISSDLSAEACSDAISILAQKQRAIIEEAHQLGDITSAAMAGLKGNYYL